jgi:D-amino peptidase
MKIYISADIEGITGATHWDEANKTHADYGEFREQMTAEVAAACEGALAAGANEIWVKDAHWTGRNILASKLPRQVKLIRDWSSHPFAMMQELDESFQAALMIGYHSRAGGGTSPLGHTMSGGVAYVKINERYASEFLLNTYTAALVNVPVVFISGDGGVCAEAEAFVSNLGTVAVKQCVGNSTINIHPQLAVEKIRAGVEAALKGDVSKCRIRLPDHFSIEAAYKEHVKAYQSSFFPGASLKDPYTVQFEADDYFDVLRFVLFGISLAS